MTEGPTDGNGEGEDPPERAKLIVFPGGKKVDPDEVGAGYIVGQTGDIPTSEVVDPVAVDEEVRKRTEYVKKQELVKVVRQGANTANTIDILLLEIAEEISHLKWERRKAAREGKNTANYTVQRINSLRSFAEVLLKRKEAALAERLDLKSPRFQAVFKVWMEFFYSSMEKAGVDQATMDTVFEQMRADMIDWEVKMEAAAASAV
jgi:hypothetical protein